MDRPSRFDKPTREYPQGHLWSGWAGDFAEKCLLAGGNPKIHRQSVEIRTLESLKEPFLPGTKCILLMGDGTIQRYIPGVTLNEQRGSPFTADGINFVATYAPQDAQDRQEYFSDDDEDEDGTTERETAEAKTTHGRTQRRNWRFWMRQDIKKAVRLTTSAPKIGVPNYHIRPEIDEVIRLLTTTKGKDFYFDIETDSNLQMTCFGFSFDDKDIYVVPMLQTHLPKKEYYYTDTPKLLRALAIALRDNTVVIHNSMFDLFVLAWRYGIPLSGRVFDTMLAHNRCYIEVEKSLGHCISYYTDLPYHKNEGVFEPHNVAQMQQLLEYNGKDVYALTQIKPAILETAKRLGALESVEQVNRMVLPYLTMTLQGMNLSEKKIEEIVVYHQRFNQQILRILRLGTGRDFNPQSWQQVSGYLYGDDKQQGLGIPKPAKDPTNEKTLLQLLLKREIPAIHCILKYRGNAKRISKAGIKTKKGEPRYWWGPLFQIKTSSPRLTCSWILSGTKTMRLGSRKLLRRWGDNSQNYEKMLRKTVVPDPGKCFLQVDQSGAEALIVAYLCRPGQFRDLFLTGINPHVFLGMHLFRSQFEAELGFSLSEFTSMPVREVSSQAKWPEIAKCIKASDDWEPARRYYFIAKQGNHSLNYDCKARAFRLNTLLKSEGAVALDLEVAQQVINTRNALFPEIGSWQQEVVLELRRTQVLRNLFGHPRVFTSWIEESMYKEAYAFKAQSTVGQITNYAITEMQERIAVEDKVLVEAEADVLQNNHDSMLVQCLIPHKEAVGRIMQGHMNRRLVSPRGEEFFMKSDIQWSDKSWGEMEALKL